MSTRTRHRAGAQAPGGSRHRAGAQAPGRGSGSGSGTGAGAGAGAGGQRAEQPGTVPRRARRAHPAGRRGDRRAISSPGRTG
ncbi:hypothetical protein IHE61_05025 [Streptomyces sp. GKU 257-1]|nr:hypothetical protein [Streptomyces sp. GKU 257-1]